MNLEDLGFDPDFFKNSVPKNMKIARVIAVDKGSYVIHNGDRESRAEITGKFMFNAESSLDYPTVGDWVATQFFDDDDFAVIHQVLPRKSLLKRKAAGKKVQVVSMASRELFESQPEAIRESVVPAGARVVVCEAGVRSGWELWAKTEDLFCLDRFGESGPADKVAAHLGFTSDALAKLIEAR